MAERKAADLKKVKELIDRVLHDNYANLKEILETEALTRFCSRLYSDNAVTSTSVSNPCFNTIMKEFKAKMLFMKRIEDFSKHYHCFILSLQSVGGPATFAAEALEIEWTEEINKELPHLSFQVVPAPKQAGDSEKDEKEVSRNQLSYLNSTQPTCTLASSGADHYHPFVPRDFPNSSSRIWYYMQVCPYLRDQLLSSIAENGFKETLEKSWQVVVSRLDNTRPKSIIDEQQSSYFITEPHQSLKGNHEGALWTLSQGKPSDDDSGRPDTEQVVPCDRTSIPHRAMTDPSFLFHPNEFRRVPDDHVSRRESRTDLPPICDVTSTTESNGQSPDTLIISSSRIVHSTLITVSTEHTVQPAKNKFWRIGECVSNHQN